MAAGVPQNAIGRKAHSLSDRDAGARDTVYRKPAAKKAAPAKSGGGGGGGHKKSGGGGGGGPRTTAAIPTPRPSPMDTMPLAAMFNATQIPGSFPSTIQDPQLPPVPMPDSLGGIPIQQAAMGGGGGGPPPVPMPQDLGGVPVQQAAMGAGAPPPPGVNMPQTLGGLPMNGWSPPGPDPRDALTQQILQAQKAAMGPKPGRGSMGYTAPWTGS